MAQETLCRVCGYDDGDVRWDEQACPTYVICNCCGAEAGYQDALLNSVKSHRQRWLDTGMTWRGSGGPPLGWEGSRQLERLPLAWR